MFFSDAVNLTLMRSINWRVSYAILEVHGSIHMKVKLYLSFMLSLSLNLGTQIGERHLLLQSVSPTYK